MDDGLASDFAALWQSELTAMAADRELRESWAALLTLWASATDAARSTWRGHEPPPGSAGAAQPPGPAAPGLASGSGLAEIERLHRRIDELERRLATNADHRDTPAG
jgi:hypothetical protein